MKQVLLIIIQSAYRVHVNVASGSLQFQYVPLEIHWLTRFSVMPLMQTSFYCVVIMCNYLLFILPFGFETILKAFHSKKKKKEKNDLSAVLIAAIKLLADLAEGIWIADRVPFWSETLLFVARTGRACQNKYPWFEKHLISGYFCWSV